MDKEKFRKLYKQSNNPSHYEKFKLYRKDVKKLIKEKMRSNFDDDENENIITKKFWSYVKSTSNSSRLPDCMSAKGKFRNNPRRILQIFLILIFMSNSLKRAITILTLILEMILS